MFLIFSLCYYSGHAVSMLFHEHSKHAPISGSCTSVLSSLNWSLPRMHHLSLNQTVHPWASSRSHLIQVSLGPLEPFFFMAIIVLLRCIHVYVCVYLCVYIFVCTSMWLQLFCIYTCVHIYNSLFLYVHVHLHTHGHIFIYIYNVPMPMYVHICIYM